MKIIYDLMLIGSSNFYFYKDKINKLLDWGYCDLGSVTIILNLNIIRLR